MRTNRGQRQVAGTLFPQNFWIFRNLSVRVGDGDVSTASLSFGQLRVVLPQIVAELSHRSQNQSTWTRYRSVTEDNLELAVPTRVSAQVEPESWWCDNCNSFFNGPIGRARIQNGSCPNCNQRRIVQFASIFMCPRCHRIDPVTKPICPECGDSSKVLLRGTGGRRRDYKWVCQQHAGFVKDLARVCPQHTQQRMVLKATSGIIYRAERIVRLNYDSGTEVGQSGSLRFRRGRASVVEAIVGRTPIANPRSFYSTAPNREISVVEPFVNQATGNFTAYVAQLETDAVIIEDALQRFGDHITIHSLKHALLNAAPAVTGLTQEEFGGYIDEEHRRLVIYDNVRGGTGGSRLLADRRRDRWLAVAKELAECHQVQCEAACRACLFLPARVCKENNLSLDRHRVLTLLE